MSNYICWACEKEEKIEKMILVFGDFYVCDTKECLLGTIEKLVDEKLIMMTVNFKGVVI